MADCMNTTHMGEPCGPNCMGNPPTRPACGEPYPLMPEFACTHPDGHDGLHGYDGPFPPEETDHG